MRRITVTSDLFVMLGLLAVMLGHFRYTRRVVQAAKAPAAKRPRPSGNGLSIPAAATAAVVAGTALLKSATRRSTAPSSSKPL